MLCILGRMVHCFGYGKLGVIAIGSTFWEPLIPSGIKQFDLRGEKEAYNKMGWTKLQLVGSRKGACTPVATAMLEMVSFAHTCTISSPPVSMDFRFIELYLNCFYIYKFKAKGSDKKNPRLAISLSDNLYHIGSVWILIEGTQKDIFIP